MVDEPRTRRGRASGGVVSRPLTIRPPAPHEVCAARLLQLRELPYGLGARFTTRHHQAFVESPHATALVAVEDRDASVVGIALGTLDASSHRSYVLRRHGWWLAGHELARAVGDPALRRRLLRAPLLALLRFLARLRGETIHSWRGHEDPELGKPEGEERTGDLACVVVDPRWRGLGVGTALVGAYETQARRAGLDVLRLASPAGVRDAGSFFSRLGWRREGVRLSCDGERFILYSRSLDEDSIPRMPGISGASRAADSACEEAAR